MNDDISDNNKNNNKSDKTKSNIKHKYLVEIVGTFILVYAIASAATVYSDSGQLGVIGIGLVHALALTAIIYAIGYRSGAQKLFCWLRTGITANIINKLIKTPKVKTRDLCMSFLND